MQEFNLPDVGEGLTEAEIVAWKVAVGDVVKVNDIIVDIETAKSIVELPSPYEGVVQGLLVAEGETVSVGTPIIRIADESPTPADESRTPAEEPRTPADESGTPAEESRAADANDSSTAVSDSRAGVSDSRAGVAEERNPVLVGYGPRTASLKRRARKSAGGAEQGTPPTPTTPPTAAAPAPTAPERPVRVLAKPPVRKLAKDLGIDLRAVPAAGDIITRADVEAYANTSRAEALPRTTTPEAPGDTRIAIKGVRKMTAAAMVASAFTAPHVTEWVTVDVTKTMDLVRSLKRDKAYADVGVSPLLIVAKAVCLAMRRTPELNATWDESAQEIVLKGSVNLGIAAATPRGLVVPNIVGADRMTLLQLAEALTELVRTARDGRTQPAQMAGGTFTITNVGVFGIDAGTPILNPGESGILAVGAIAKRPWVNEGGELVVREVTTLALSFDHRVVDGEQGSKYLADVAAILNDPAVALTF